MTKRDKLLKKIRQHPKNVSFQELRTLLEAFGFELQRTRGSHHSFVRKSGGRKRLLAVPYAHPLKAVYVRMALALIDEILAEEEGL